MNTLTTLLIATLAAAAVVDADLVLLQAVWRHGDRTPTYTCKGDPNKEELWKRYGGFGQLTPTGMDQHLGLGNLIYNRYAVDEKFLSEKYNPKEMYVRSTDLNRTMISATANMIGMYYKRGNAVENNDYPGGVKWPPFYVPIPIHTVRNWDDYVMNPDAVCPRQTWLWNQVTETPEWRNLTQTNAVFMKELSNKCQENVDMANDLWKIKDAFMIESIYNITLPVSNETFQTILRINNEIENMQNGMDLKPYNGIDFRVEIGKIRGGGLLWNMIDHIDLKLFCRQPGHENNYQCNWMKSLKYYAYSAHDTTVGALLAVLKAKEKIIQTGGYPAYSSAVFVELHQVGNDSCLKFFFHRDFKSQVEDITADVEGCENQSCCSYAEFRQLYKKFYPSSSEVQLCQDRTSKSTYFDRDQASTKQTRGSLRFQRPKKRSLKQPVSSASPVKLTPVIVFASMMSWISLVLS